MPERPSLREENRRRVRERIVDAAVALARERGDVTFTMPEVAERSGVALRTLYRYYPKRQDVVDALATVADQVDALPLPRSLDEIEGWLVAAWRNLMAEETLLRAQHRGPSGAEIRRARVARHRAITGGLIDELHPELDAETRRDLIDTAMLVSSSTAMFELIDILDIDLERAARLSATVIVTMIETSGGPPAR